MRLNSKKGEENNLMLMGLESEKKDIKEQKGDKVWIEENLTYK